MKTVISHGMWNIGQALMERDLSAAILWKEEFLENLPDTTFTI